MYRLTRPFTPSSNIVFNSDITSSTINTIKDNYDLYLANNIVSPGYRVITGATTLNLATDQVVEAGGTTAYTITLPSIPNYNVTLRILKTSNNKNGTTSIPITISAGTGQKINGQDTYTLFTKDSYVELFGNSTINGSDWRVQDRFNNVRDLSFYALKQADQTPGGAGASLVTYENDSTGGAFDRNNDYDTTTSLYTVPYPGDYVFNASFYVLNGTSTAIDLRIAEEIESRIQPTADIVVLSGAKPVTLTAGQSVRVVVNLVSAVRTLRGSASVADKPSKFVGRCINLFNQ